MSKAVRVVPLVFLLSTLTANADNISIPKYQIPQLNYSKIMEGKKGTSFAAAKKQIRGKNADVFAKALPSVVKVLTNDGHGSGVIASRQGFILTNYHVIEGYETVGVLFSSDSDGDDILLADVVRVDQIADLALLKLKGPRPGLVSINPAKSKPKIGDDVHAIGHPYGEDWTYTRGYVSQYRKNYAWQSGIADHHVADVIQTQTPINPGNSGGPLLNDNGELIGINSFGNSQAEGINFAVSLDTVSSFLKLKTNRVRKISTAQPGVLVNSEDENKNGNPDGYLWDSNSNQIVDIYGLDKDENQIIEKLFIDKNENGIAELTVILGASLPNPMPGIIYAFDENEDETIDGYGHDENEDGQIDKFY